MSLFLRRLCAVVLALSIPILLTLTNVRLLMTPLLPNIEYRLPYFPADAYGITQAQRLYWAQRSIDYILSDPRAGAIEAWKFPEDGVSPVGTQAPIESCSAYGNDYGPRDCSYFYNDREVKHMVDVQIVTRGALAVWGVTALLAGACAALLWRAGQRSAVRGALLSGAGITVVLYVGIIVYIALNFAQLFVQFHQVFFEGSTWLFLWSDSLIRLFPVVFWRDAFIFIGAASLLEALAVGWGARRITVNSEQ